MPSLAYTAPEGTPDAVARAIAARLPSLTGRPAYDEPLAEAWAVHIETTLSDLESECTAVPPCARVGSEKHASQHAVRTVRGTRVTVDHATDGHTPQDTATATRVIGRAVALAVARAESDARSTYATVAKYAPTIPTK